MGALDSAFGGSKSPSVMDRNSKYSQYDLTPLEAAAGQPSAAPAGPGQPASQGALPGGAPSGAAPVNPPAFSSEIEGAPDPNKAPDVGGKDFFSFWQEGSDEDRKAIADEVAGPIESKGMSTDGAVKQMYDTNPEMAKEVGAKYGLSAPSSPDGMAEFKLYDQALLDYQDDMESMEKKKKMSSEKKLAMGGFLFEMGLRILASNRGDAGGAIGEGALGTFEAQRTRAKENRAVELAEEDRTYELGERGEKATDRERRRTQEDDQGERLKSAEERAKSEEKRRQEEHDAKMKSGALATGTRGPTAFEVQWNFYRAAHGDEEMDREAEQKLRQEFLSYYNRESRMTTKDREMMINSYIKLNDENPDDAWYDLTGPEKRQAAIDAMGIEDDKDADNDPLGLRDK